MLKQDTCLLLVSSTTIAALRSTRFSTCPDHPVYLERGPDPFLGGLCPLEAGCDFAFAESIEIVSVKIIDFLTLSRASV